MIKDLINELRKLIPFKITDSEIISLSLDISRTSDSKITKHINLFKSQYHLKLNSIQKNKIRDYIIGRTKQWDIKKINPINKEIIKDADIITSLKTLLTGIKRNKEGVLGTMSSRLINNTTNSKKLYEKIIEDLEKNNKQLIVLNIKHEDKLSAGLIKSTISSIYDKLSNFHNLAIIFENIDWKTIADVSVFCENFKLEDNFNVFNKQKENKNLELINFLKTNKNININKELEAGVKNYYKSLLHGFQFNDLLISSSENIKILLLQKIQLDENLYPCPDCLKKMVRGNSYPKLMQKSFECQNPNCPSRSKIGRGKRYDLLSVKRNLKLQDEKNIIKSDFAKKFRRDIFESKDYLEMLIRFYSWNNDNILILKNLANKKGAEILFGRKVEYKNFNYGLKLSKKTNLEVFLELICKNINTNKEKAENLLNSNLFCLVQGDSSNVLLSISKEITGAVTSPPYYNAREYSQWPSFLCYLIDMAINASSVYSKLKNKSLYFYNIGDIVGQDNVYVSSHMSKRRLMLGFYSVLIFEQVGFKLIDNIIWDKGEVQSKRNSTENLFPGYIKPINCYEHIFIFSKGEKNINIKNHILKLDSVKKINSKGENKLGHTAPYPESLVETVFNYMDKTGYILDPFLGSGTTVMAGIKNNIKTIGVELNSEYYKLSSNRIKNLLDKHTLS